MKRSTTALKNSKTCRNELVDNAALEESYGDADEHFGNETHSMRDGDNGGGDAAEVDGRGWRVQFLLLPAPSV